MKLRVFWLVGLVLVTGANVAQAQFRYRTNNYAITITGYTGTNGNVAIPDTITDLPVVSIGDYAFQNAYVLTNVTIPSGVSYLGNSLCKRPDLDELQPAALPHSLTLRCSS